MLAWHFNEGNPCSKGVNAYDAGLRLFSGQLMADTKAMNICGLRMLIINSGYEADSDELRSAAEGIREGLREHHLWQKSRKPGTHFR